MVPPSSDRISRVPPYLSRAQFHTRAFAYGAITLYGRSFQDRFANTGAKSRRLFPFRSPLLWESRLISVPAVTEMFQFSAFAPMDLFIQSTVTLAGRVSPFGNLRIKAHLPAPRSLSQAVASFIACYRQGIHHMHLFA